MPTPRLAIYKPVYVCALSSPMPFALSFFFASISLGGIPRIAFSSSPLFFSSSPLTITDYPVRYIPVSIPVRCPVVLQNAWRRYSEAFLSDTISIEGKGQTPAMQLLEQQGQRAVKDTMQRLQAIAQSKQPKQAKSATTRRPSAEASESHETPTIAPAPPPPEPPSRQTLRAHPPAPPEPRDDFIEMDFSSTSSEAVASWASSGVGGSDGTVGTNGSLSSSRAQFEDALRAAEERVIRFVRSEFDELRRSFVTPAPTSHVARGSAGLGRAERANPVLRF